MTFEVRKPPSARVFWLVWLSTVALAAGCWFIVMRAGLGRSKIFRRTAQGVQLLPKAGLTASDVGVSDRGEVWVLTMTGPSRLNGASWTHFNSTAMGCQYSNTFGELALDGDEVWIV